MFVRKYLGGFEFDQVETVGDHVCRVFSHEYGFVVDSDRNLLSVLLSGISKSIGDAEKRRRMRTRRLSA